MFSPSDRWPVRLVISTLFLLGLILVLGSSCAGAVRGRAP